jgi:hypothetical protein
MADGSVLGWPVSSRVMRRRPGSLRFLGDILVGIAIATTLGLSTAWLALNQGRIVGAVHVGAWTAWPDTGGPDADPYSVAVLARTGEIPLGAGEGLAFTAESDDAGEPLSGRCSYVVAGQTPAARLWTLTAYDQNGHLMANAARRTGFHSRELLRRPDGSFAIVISGSAKPGNWLPLGTNGPFRLVLRLYDTPLTTGNQFGDVTMPEITKRGCR